MKRLITFVAIGPLSVLCLGCGTDSSSIESQLSPSQASSTLDGSQFILASEPTNVQDVVVARASAENGQEIAIIGRIGGNRMPWIENRSAFSIVDMTLNSCLKTGDSCPTPWDYCCETHKLSTATALVKFTDESGDLIATDARKLLNVKELDTVVVQGTAKRDDAGNLTVIASGMFVKR